MTIAMANQIADILKSKGINPDDVQAIELDLTEAARLGHPVITVRLKPRVEKIQVDFVLPEVP